MCLDIMINELLLWREYFTEKTQLPHVNVVTSHPYTLAFFLVGTWEG